MRYSSTLLQSTADSLDDLLGRLAELGLDLDGWREQAIATHKVMQGGIVSDLALRTDALEARWYISLERGEPDYGVYDTGAYVLESWACWRVYARRYLRNLTQPSTWIGPGELCLLDDCEPVHKVVDLGCGLGYTTAVWKEWYPQAEVWGTNIPETLQWRVAEPMSHELGFRLVEGPEVIATAVDVVFASEYFEHFHQPLEHLEDVLGLLEPQCLIIANAFGSRSCGHFDQYEVGGRSLDGPATSRAFHTLLRAHGYAKVKTKMWNNRPAYWVLART